LQSSREISLAQKAELTQTRWDHADIKIILTSEGDLVTKNLFSHSRLSKRQQMGRGKFSPVMSFDEIFGEWEARWPETRISYP